MVSKAVRLSHNVWSSKYFAIAIGAIIVLFAIYHWIGKLHAKYSSRKLGQLSRLFRILHLSVRPFLDQTIFGQRIGRWILYFVYWIINLILLLTNVELENPGYVAKRLGWVSVSNLVLLTFLSLRYTPLAPLCGKSYEKLRPLHKTSGYTCITTSILHGVVYLIAWAQDGDIHKMAETKNFAGAIAGLAMFAIGLSTVAWIMRRYYEVFYIFHVVMYMLILIMVGMHRPKFKSSTIAIVIFTACLWFTDRFLRLAKLCWYFFGNRAYVTVMPDDTMRVTLKRSLQCTPGSHAFLWIPSVSIFQTHPFTLVSNNPVEFLIRAQDGFTRELYNAARKEPGKLLWCSVDGGYGHGPDFSVFNSVVLVAGGSGASFTFSIALDLVEKASRTGRKQVIDFIWTVKQHDSLVWFKKELTKLQEHPNVNLIIHVTGKNPMSTISSPIISAAVPGGNTLTEKNGPSTTEKDIEMGPMFQPPEAQTMSSFTDTRAGRPDIAHLISSRTENCHPGDRVCVAACGPDKMIDTTRQAVSEASSNPDVSITLHSEEFGW